jgi:hypothetical protein
VFLINGTFYCSPLELTQLYVIHCRLFKRYFPCLFCFLKNKEENSYSRLFEIIKRTLLPCGLRYIILDFEKAPINACKILSVNSKVLNCLFHFGQIIWRNIQKHGLTAIYKSDPRFRILIKSLMALSFLPLIKVKEGFQLIKQKITSAYNLNEMNSFLLFFQNNYIDNDSYIKWNATERLIENIPLTTNICEGYNNSINSLLTTSHPSLINLLLILREKDSITERNIDIALCENTALPQRKKESIKTENLKDLVSRCEEYSILDYLKAIAINYNWSFE